VCADAVQTEAEGHVFYQTVISLEGDPEETLNCLATWPNDQDQSETFLVATLDFRYACPGFGGFLFSCLSSLPNFAVLFYF
jgi:hypothetical protein